MCPSPDSPGTRAPTSIHLPPRDPELKPVQSCRLSALIVRRAQQWKQEEHHADCAHAMADFEGGNSNATPKHGIITRYATRYGGIVEQVTEVNGIRKVVLVVNARLPTSEDRDAYADWFRRWCQRQETVSSDAGEGASDEMTPLIGVEEPETSRYCEVGGDSPLRAGLHDQDGSTGCSIGGRIKGWLCREPKTVKRLLTYLMKVTGLSSANQTLFSGSPPNHTVTTSI
ncbi:hypothetical protein BJX96DRAFT_62081 [Aspergillus floccosus]